jgi:FMN phosphatase YigB (HAD superfamily)
MDKKVAFDIGNVLCHVDLPTFFQVLVDEGLAPDMAGADDFLCGIQYPQDLGLYSIRQGVYRFNPNISRKTLDVVHDVWVSIIKPSPEMLLVLEDALSIGYQVSLLSNIGFDHSEILRRKCDLFKYCIQHFSCEVGARKPTKLFYQSFQLQHGWPKSAKFFDDREDNIKAANDYFHSILFDLEGYSSDLIAANTMRTYLF